MSDIWNKVYKDRRKKVGAKKAKFSANAAEKSEYVKEFLESTLYSKVKKNWKKEVERVIIESKKDYRVFKTEDENVIITTEEKVLRDFADEPRKGKIGTISDEHTREVIMKTKEDNDINLNPNLYYVIYKG